MLRSHKIYWSNVKNQSIELLERLKTIKEMLFLFWQWLCCLNIKSVTALLMLVQIDDLSIQLCDYEFSNSVTLISNLVQPFFNFLFLIFWNKPLIYYLKSKISLASNHFLSVISILNKPLYHYHIGSNS